MGHLRGSLKYVVDYCFQNHADFGGPHFIEMTIGVNLAIKGIAVFRTWIENLASHTIRKGYPKWVNILDSPQKEDIEGEKVDTLIRSVINGLHRTSSKLFRLFSLISWACVIWAGFLLYVGASHCSNLMLIMVWPLYVIIVFTLTKFRCNEAAKKLRAWDEIEHVVQDEKALSEQIKGDFSSLIKPPEAPSSPTPNPPPKPPASV
jgi:hypothetical protein